MLNVPNVITILRIILVPTYLWAMYAHIPYANQWACLLFIIAGLTDLLDGHIARKYGMVTNLGKVMDPVADKIMVAAAMIVLVDLHHLAAWIVILMLFRDFAVGALRDIAAQQGTIIAAGIWGKLKTALQMVSLCFLIFYDSVVVWPLSVWGVHMKGGLAVPSGYVTLPVFEIGMVLMYMALVASILSGVIYFKQYSKMIVK